MKRLLLSLSLIISFFALTLAQERRPISNEHPMWMCGTLPTRKRLSIWFLKTYGHTCA